MPIHYGFSFVCDGCGSHTEVWPESKLGQTPSMNDSLPRFWKWIKCRDFKHRYEQPAKHLAYIIACPNCIPQVDAWQQKHIEWKEKRQREAKRLINVLLGWIGYSMESWEKVNPQPSQCWLSDEV